MEVMTSQELLRQHMTDSAIEDTLKKSDSKKTKSKKHDGYENCPQCDKQVKASGMTKHIKIHNFDAEYHCNQCKSHFKTKQYLQRHVAIVHCKEDFKLKCQFCGKMFKFKDKLKQHEMTHTGEKPHKCHVCDKSFRALYSLNTHILIHTDEKPYACAFCDYKCRDTSTLRKHQDRHLGNVERYHCKLCTLSYGTKALLKVHIAQDHLQLEETRVECHICNNKYRDNSSLRNHIRRIHDKSSQTQCNICDKTLDQGNLKAHLRTHANIRPYKCDYHACDKRFKCKGDMNKHSLIHYPSKHHVCKECGRIFVKAYLYAKHLRAGHEKKEKTEKCRVCKVMFFTRNHLLKHMHMKHSTIKKQYWCDHCQFKTTIKPSLIGHLKSHEHDSDRECRICHIKYKEYEYLKSHYLRTHKIRYKPEKFAKVKKKKLIRPKMLDAEELARLKESKIEGSKGLSVEVKIEAMEIVEDVTFSDLKNLKDEQPTTGTSNSNSMDAAQALLAKRVSERVKEFNKVEGFDEFVDKRIVEKNMDFRTKPTESGKVVNYLKIASEKDVNRLLRKANKRKQIELEDSDRWRLDRIKRIYNERLMQAARKREIKDTKQLNKILKVKLKRDPTIDSIFLNDSYDIVKENIAENNNNLNNNNGNDDLVVENDNSVAVNDIDSVVVETDAAAVQNDISPVANDNDNLFDDTFTFVNDNLNEQSDTIIDESSKKSLINTSIFENDTPAITNKIGVQYNTNRNLNDNNYIVKNTENVTNNIEIPKTVNLSLSKDNITKKPNKNTNFAEPLLKTTDLTLLCNSIDKETNTSYWDISHKNEHRIVQEKRVLEINVEIRQGDDGNTEVNILGHHEKKEIKTDFIQSDVKTTFTNDSTQNEAKYTRKVITKDKIPIDNDQISKSDSVSLVSNSESINSTISIKNALAFENDSDDDTISYDIDSLLMSNKDKEKWIIQSESDISMTQESSKQVTQDGLNLSRNKLKTKKSRNEEKNNQPSENDSHASHSKKARKDGLISATHNNLMRKYELLKQSKASQNNILPDRNDELSENDKQMSQIAELMSENDSPLIEIYMPVSESESDNPETDTNATNTFNQSFSLDVDVESIIQGARNDSDLEKIVHQLEKEIKTPENKNDTSENDKIVQKDNPEPRNDEDDMEIERDDLGNENHDFNDKNQKSDKEIDDLPNEDDETDIQTASNTDDNTKYKKLNSKKIKFNTSQCYVCFKLFNTKEELLEHCKQHFDICSENRLKKCPLCNFVGREYLRKHLLTKHNISIDQAKFNRINANENGSFTIDVAQKPTASKIQVTNIEIIPSVKQLNKQASQKIDETNRLNKKSNIFKRKLVKKGKEWIVETENVNLNYLDYLVPIGKDASTKTDEDTEFDYLEQLAKLSLNAKKEERTILYPCDRCDLICTGMAALKAHRKSHDKIKTGKRKNKDLKRETVKKIDKNDLKTKGINPKLLEFFESNVKGVDYDDFEQFSQIYKVIDNLSDDKLALASSNKDYGLPELVNDKTDNSEENNKFKKKYSKAKTSGLKQVVNLSNDSEVKTNNLKSKLGDKIKLIFPPLK